MEFNPSRLALGRKRLGLSKTTLAEESGISVRSLGYYESETSNVVPSEEHLNILATILKLPLEFFFGPDLEEFNCDAASFRSLTTLTASEREAALANGRFAMLLSDWIDKKFHLPSASIPSLRDFEAEAAAQALRDHWGLGQRPISNIVHCLESRGARVFSLPVDSRAVDAFSLWHGEVPFVFLNTKKSAEHTRFDSAHELGHLTLHTHGTPRSSRKREIETEANRFASAFLMPEGDLLAHIPPPRTITMRTIHRLKKRWGVSAIALVFRLHKLKVISDWQYRSLCVQLSGEGYRSSEADGIKRDGSQIFAKVFSALKAEGVTRGTIARELNLTPSLIDSLLVGLVIAGVPTSADDGDTTQSANDNLEEKTIRPNLRAV
jgi:Zn-dependent peptidase ImmA (M78 family)/DNA-binding XRE family transcriptional regulator